MKELNIISANHYKTNRNYLERVTDVDFPKWKAAILAKKWGYDYWDGDRKINYGGYFYKPGYWTAVAKKLISTYSLNNSSRILDIGCGKGYLLFEIKKILPDIYVCGIDISEYAIIQALSDTNLHLNIGNATKLPWPDKQFDLAFSINTFHNLYTFELEAALLEISRVSFSQFICIESYRNEFEKMNLLYWQVTCESFFTPDEWKWWFRKFHYSGDYEFIYFQ